jgi:4-diphosphocytidyl-2-C-methyl-D-erythritol kinase
LARLEGLAGRPLGQAIALTKNIPAAAGLGGGSADAAAVLRAAGPLGVAAERDQLHALALELGADVPFQLMGGIALVGGIGEQISELPPLELWFAVAYPGIAVSTAEVFAELRPDELSDGDAVTAAAGRLREAVATAPGGGPAGRLAPPDNALWGPATRRYPGLAAAAGALRAAGWVPRLTGSGSALYHVSIDEAEARSLAAAAGQAGVTTWVCHSLPAHPW